MNTRDDRGAGDLQLTQATNDTETLDSLEGGAGVSVGRLAMESKPGKLRRSLTGSLPHS